MLAIIVTSVVVFLIIIGLIVSATQSVTESPTTVIKENTILTIDVNRVIAECSENNSIAAFSDGDAFVPGLYDMMQTIQYAATDKQVKGILLKVSGSPNGWATQQQLRKALYDFKAKGKFVVAYAESITQKSYYLANVSNKVFLNPAGSFELKGLASQIPFFKGTLDMLEVKPEIFYAGKFKSATEPFREQQMSEPNKIQIREYQNDLWADFITQVAAKTGTDTETVHQWATAGSVQFPNDALQYKLVDGLLYWDEVEQYMRTLLGKKEEDKLNYQDVNEYAAYVKTKKNIKENKIALLYAEGNIVDGEATEERQIASETIIKEIRKIKKNDKIKAVVIRVNSGGGSALASEVILRELQLLKEKKPIIISMGDVAASGGYYIACQADSIFAMPNTLTGSIGVFTMLFNTQTLLKNKLGITFDAVKNTPYADFPSGTRPLTTTEAQRMQASVDTIYALFKRRVATARNMSLDAVDSIAQGRVWTGADAVKINLVDGLGGLDRAFASAAKKAGITDYQVVSFPEPVDEFAAMLRRFKSAGGSQMIAKAWVEKEFQTSYQWMSKIQQLISMNGSVQMMMPFQPNMNEK